MNKKVIDKLPSLNRDNSVSILKAESCSLISIGSGQYWSKSTIEECCLDKQKIREAIGNLPTNNRTQRNILKKLVKELNL